MLTKILYPRVKGFYKKFLLLLSYIVKKTKIDMSTRIRIYKDASITLGGNSRIAELGKIVLHQGAQLLIGNNSSVDRLCEIVIEENSKLVIGSNVFIGSNVNIRVTGQCTIGNDCRIAQFVSLINGNYGFSSKDTLIREQSYQNGVIEIDDDVWLGLSVIVLANTKVGKGCVVGAGTIVNKDVEEYSIIVGNPPRIIGKRE